MDSFQQPHGYMRPPPPPPHTADPHHHQFHQHQHVVPPSRQPAPPQGPWYSSLFQYHLSQTPSPPPQGAPPPPPAPPPHSDHFPPTASYPPPSNLYSYHHNQFPPPPPPPPRSHVPHQYPSHSHIPQPYHQEWSAPNWPPNQGWDYTGQKNEEDWAARARAWADAKAAMESQHTQSQCAPAGRLQEQNHYHDQYQQSVDSRYPDAQNQSHLSSSYQQYPVSDASMQRLPGHPREAASVSSETSYTYSARDGTTTADPTVAFQHQGNFPTNQLFHQQEVPSSYNSLTGKETADQNQQLYTLLPMSNSSTQEQHHLLTQSMHAPFISGSHSADPTIGPADQPLDFAPRYNRDSDLQMQSTYAHHDLATSVRGVNPVSGIPSMNNWAPPVAPGVAYPAITPIRAPGPQHDPSIVTPSIPEHMAPPFGRFPGPGLPPTIPAGGAPFALSAGTAVHPTAAFSADSYGISGVPERPKKASVPTWLREEIKKAVIAAPSLEHSKEENQLMDDNIDKSYVQSDEPDSKSIDSSRSVEEEEDEEDYVEAARTTAINQEIKRVLTEVLLKVTDELFDEIATKVLSEDDLIAEMGQNVVGSNPKVSASPPSASVPKASAKVLVPGKAKASENDSVSEKSNSSSPGDILGLGNYASDADDGDDEIESSSVPTPAKGDAHQSGIKKLLEDRDVHDVSDNSSSPFQLEEHSRGQTNMVNNLDKTSSSKSKTSNGAAFGPLNDGKVTKELNHEQSSRVGFEDGNNELNSFERRHDRINGSSSRDTLTKSELPGKADVKKATDDYPVRESRTRSDKADRHERSSSEKDFIKEVQNSKTRTDEKGNENHRKMDDRHPKKIKSDDSNEAKERVKEHNVRHGEKAKESESQKKSSYVDVKNDRKEVEKSHRSSAVEDTSWKKEHTNDKRGHKLRHKDASNSDRHKRRRSSSVSSRGRSSRDHAVNHASDSSSEGSDDSKRKLHSRKCELSPSPVRSRRSNTSPLKAGKNPTSATCIERALPKRANSLSLGNFIDRQVLRSPHSKHSQRRHSPYSSLDYSRGRRSRSRSPIRQQR